MAEKSIVGTDNGDNLSPDGKVWENSDVSSFTDDYTIEGRTGEDKIAGAAGNDFLDGGEEKAIVAIVQCPEALPIAIGDALQHFGVSYVVVGRLCFGGIFHT